MTKFRFSAYLFCGNSELLFDNHHNSFEKLVANMMYWLEEAPMSIFGVIYDNDRGIIVGRYNRRVDNR